ncbi:hypothetical protein Thi970DRAFT_03406 [Thiorhodovibrio frisius]|uniref:Uncharacterized protein n=1 Tax=Thiorhodovibrio frisius TaxID=631362 RepID=H8Z787_9GAMM|nr:hypothetical protein [Thiorhodovibrio frisius]EIC19803.1 hypothetical protein Thi970DRAFT_03406 [Thiorhodovibrio frisius]WPL20218.1 hypothetical protein Thiofri_00292 [Thiorhodovibrio frisius]
MLSMIAITGDDHECTLFDAATRAGLAISLQAVAPLTHINNDAEYTRMTELLHELLDVVRDDAHHALYSLVAVVGDLIETYERDQEPVLDGENSQWLN